MAKYDVFISYSSKDRDTSEALAKRLDADGIVAWLDQWRITPGDNILSRIEDGLQHSHALMLLLSSHAVGSSWTELERTSRQFRDPANRERRFIPVLIDVCDLPPTIAPLKCIDYVSRSEAAYFEILCACSPPARILRNAEFTTLVIGDLTPEGWVDARSLWHDRLDPLERRRVLVDFSRCTHLDSGGLGFLVSLHKRAKEAGAQMALYGLGPKVRETIGMLEFDRIFQIFKTHTEACDYLRNNVT